MRPLDPIRFRGISRKVIPHEILPDATPAKEGVIKAKGPGIDLFLDAEGLTGESRQQARAALNDALKRLDEADLKAAPGRRSGPVMDLQHDFADMRLL